MPSERTDAPHDEAFKIAGIWTRKPEPTMTPTLAEFKKVCRALIALRSETAPTSQPSAIGASITDNDRRWRHLEHGCQWVSWTETNGETHSFDPRNVGTGYQGDLQSMRATADEQLERQVAKLKSATSDGGRKE